jgi:hypothetical protein
VRFDATPPLADSELEALHQALRQAHLLPDAEPEAHRAPWRQIAAREAVGNVSEDSSDDELYALSPRSTRGATRA